MCNMVECVYKIMVEYICEMVDYIYKMVEYIYKMVEYICDMVHIPNFGGCQGRQTGMGVTTVSN